jgi:CHASE2 domain-containing sensor protein
VGAVLQGLGDEGQRTSTIAPVWLPPRAAVGTGRGDGRQAQQIRNLLLIAGAALLVTVIMHSSGSLQPAQERLIAEAFRARGESAPSGRVVVVGIDQAALASVHPWPWPRPLVARLVRAVQRKRPAAVAVLLDLTDGRGRQDRELLRLLQRIRAIVIVKQTPSPASVTFLGRDIPRFGARLRITHDPLSTDGIFHLKSVAHDGALPAFNAAVAAAARPRAPGGSQYIDFARVPEVSAGTLLRGGGRRLRGRVAVIGPTTTAVGETTPTPFGSPAPRTIVRAQEADSAVRGYRLHEQRLLTLLLSATLALAVSLAARLSPWLSAAVAAGAVALVCLLFYLLFRSDELLGAAYILHAVLLAYLLAALLPVLSAVRR